jgi:crotonobetainyl-CoA:carnitine CoA-transferase CaiB-like acyl-CoA transferase
VPGPLPDLTVLDRSRAFEGPWCAQVSADLGATVIEAEKPGAGDDTRAWGPSYPGHAHGDRTTEPARHVACSRGEQSVSVDFTLPGVRDLVRAPALGRLAGRGIVGVR